MSEKDMEEKEGLYIPRRLMELDSHPIEGNFDLEHLCKAMSQQTVDK